VSFLWGGGGKIAGWVYGSRLVEAIKNIRSATPKQAQT